MAMAMATTNRSTMGLTRRLFLVAAGLVLAIEGFFLLRRGVAVMTTTFEERDDALKERGDAEELEPRRESRPAWDGVVPPQRSAVDGASLCRLIGDDPRFAPPTRRVAADGGTRDGARRRMVTLARHLLSPWNATGIAAPPPRYGDGGRGPGTVEMVLSGGRAYVRDPLHGKADAEWKAGPEKGDFDVPST